MSIDLRRYPRKFPIKYWLIGPKYYHFETKRHRELIRLQKLIEAHREEIIGDNL